MPELKPFPGIRYPDRDLSDRTCPPYDVISPEEQRLLYDRHPHNAVRLELPLGDEADKVARYRSADATFGAWLTSGVLVRDEEPGVYVYRQDFVDPRDGSRRRVAGIIGALALEDLGERRGVLPHERTMPGPIEDRLRLMRACPVNISPLYLIYRGGGGIAPFVDSLEHRPPAVRFADEQGILHRLWTIRAQGEIHALTGAVAAQSLVVADGHHRYETALAYHREQGGGPGPHDAVMAFCVDADSEELVVLPYHRLLHTSVDADELSRRLREDLGGRFVPLDDGLRRLSASHADHPFLFVLPEETALVELDDAFASSALGNRAPAWRALDVVVLHEALLPRLFRGESPRLEFSRDEAEIGERVADGRATAGVLLRPVSPVQVIEVARSGERMPQKASYFWPKAVTGMVFRPLR